MHKILLIVLAVGLSATACSGVPSFTVQPTATVTPTLAPTVTPTPAAPAPAPSQAGKRAQPGNHLQALLKTTGLSGGVVSANTNGVLSVKLAKTTDQIATSASTLVILPGKASAQVSDIRVGDRVVADFGTPDNSIAVALLDFPADFNADNLLMAAVQANKNGTVMVRTRQGTQTLDTMSATRVINLSGAQPAMGTLADIKLGNAVLVIGQPNGSAMFDAQVIIVLDKNVRNIFGKAKPAQPEITPTPTPKPGA